MKYHVLRILDKELKCRLTTQATVQLERKFGENLMLTLLKKKILGATEIAEIINASLQKFEHGYTINKVYDLIDEYVDEGGDLMALQNECMEIFKVSGFFANGPQQTNRTNEVDMEEVQKAMKLIAN